MQMTYDLSRYRISDGQIVVGGIYNFDTWEPGGPNASSLATLSYYQTVLNKQLEYAPDGECPQFVGQRCHVLVRRQHGSRWGSYLGCSDQAAGNPGRTDRDPWGPHGRIVHLTAEAARLHVGRRRRRSFGLNW
jgi:hypothetical protein